LEYKSSYEFNKRHEAVSFDIGSLFGNNTRFILLTQINLLERRPIMKSFLSVVLILLVGISLSQAQYKPTSNLLVFNVGFTKATPEDSDNSLDGNAFTLFFEKSNYGGNLAGGVALSYGTTTDDSEADTGIEDGRVNSASYEVIPITVYGKYLFGTPKIKGYLGAGVGIQFSEEYFFLDNVQVWGQDSGFLVGGLAGLYYFFNEGILLNANYNFNYLDNSYYKDGYSHTFNLGLGFQF